MTEMVKKRPAERLRLAESDRVGLQLLVVTRSSERLSNGGQPVAVQLSSRDERAVGQRGLHLANGSIRCSPEDWATIQRVAAGPNTITLPTGTEVYAVMADLVPGIRRRTFGFRQIRPSPERVDDRVLLKQRQAEDLARLIDSMVGPNRRPGSVTRWLPSSDDDEGGIEYGVAGQGTRPGRILRP